MVDKYNKNGKMTAVVAVRSGSQRVPNKNIRNFFNTNLLELKLNVLTQSRNIDEIIVNSDSEEMLDLAKKFKVKTQVREKYFASNEASNSEFHQNIADTTDTDYIFLAPVCSPFISANRHDEAISYFLKSNYDSLTSTHPIKGHLWQNGKPLNYDLSNVPNSQDLPDIQMLNYGISIIEKEKMKSLRALVGENPGFIELNEIESTDINTLDEFNSAELLYKHGLVEKLW